MSLVTSVPLRYIFKIPMHYLQNFSKLYTIESMTLDRNTYQVLRKLPVFHSLGVGPESQAKPPGLTLQKRLADFRKL